MIRQDTTDHKKKKGKQQAFTLETLKLLRHNKRVGMLDRHEEFGHREKLVYEVLTTEQTYVTGLEILCQIYLNKLLETAKESGGKLSEQDVTSIFGNIENLRIINQNLLKDLEVLIPFFFFCSFALPPLRSASSDALTGAIGSVVGG